MKNFRSLLLVAATAAPLPAVAQVAALAAPPERISDAAIQRDHAGYESMQARIRALSDGGRRAGDYHLAKAQCWLDASFHEYTRNDRGGFPQAAIAESEQLVALMEQRAEPLPTETRPLAGTERLRSDLWQRVGTLKQGPGWLCAAAETACAEVGLVHAGNELAQQRWRHARPYVQIAESRLDEAEALARRCTPPGSGTAASR